jgi:hypothetical protein
MNMKTNLKSFALGASLTLGLLGVYALAMSIPNGFTAGDVISAAKMNANFTAVKTAVDALEGSKVTGFRIPAVADAGNCTTINNVATNNKPNVVVVVTFSRNGTGVVKPVGASYITSLNKWFVCANDNSAQIADVEYQIMVITP